MRTLNYNYQNIMYYFSKLDEALEIYLTLHGVKPVSRIVISEDKLKSLNDFCASIGLNFEVGSFKIINKSCIIDKESDVSGSFFVYFSKDENLALEAKEAEEDFNDDRVGKLLGYPNCCREFYTQNYKNAKSYGNDFAPLTHKDTVHFNFYTNNLMRYFGYALIHHFPCRYNCIQSVKLAKEVLNLLEKDNPQMAYDIKKKLRNPIFFHKKYGVIAFDETKKENNIVHYKKPLLIAANDIYNTFNSGNNFIIGKKIIKVFKDEKLIKEFDKDVDLLAFDFS